MYPPLAHTATGVCVRHDPRLLRVLHIATMLAPRMALPPLLPPSSTDGLGPACRGNMATLHCMLGRGSEPGAPRRGARCPLQRDWDRPLARQHDRPRVRVGSVLWTRAVKMLRSHNQSDAHHRLQEFYGGYIFCASTLNFKGINMESGMKTNLKISLLKKLNVTTRCHWVSKTICCLDHRYSSRPWIAMISKFLRLSLIMLIVPYFNCANTKHILTFKHTVETLLALWQKPVSIVFPIFAVRVTKRQNE